MRILFVGGPGRSGTSFAADRLGTHPQIAAFKDIELKIFCEKNGLQDLFHALSETYSPNRAVLALDQYQRMIDALIEGRYGQPALTTVASAGDWRACFDTFANSLLEDGHPTQHTPERFFTSGRLLLHQIAALAASDNPAEDTLFLDKTPHNLLAMNFLARLAPGARYLHVMRDPRSIAWSLLSVRWGPDQLTTAARWVDSYCSAWVTAEAQAASLGQPLTQLHIEQAATDPEATGDWLTSQLGLSRHEGLFAGANIDLLNRWTTKATTSERAQLDTRLGDWAVHFGYDPEHIGRRTVPAVSDKP